MSRIAEIIKQGGRILRKKHLSSGKRYSLFFSFIKLVIKRFFVGRVSFINTKSVSFLSYEMSFDHFNDFYWTFVEVFIEEDYYFETSEEAPVIIDCGANIGVSIVYFKWLYPKSIITAFEIEPDNINFLEFNIKVNKLQDINLVTKAVGRESGKTILRGNRRAGSISKALIDEQSKKDESYKEYEIEIEVVTLSKYIDKQIDFLKMDIEGAETGVFQDLNEANKMQYIENTTLEYHFFSFKENKLSEIIKIFELAEFKIIFPNNYDSLSKLKRSYYNFMIRAGK